MDQPPNPHIHYQSYMLRLWCDPLGGVLRITLQNAITQQVHQFACAEELLNFLSNPPTASTDEAQTTV